MTPQLTASRRNLPHWASQFSSPRLYPEHAPDYYATFFNDRDGIRLEITNYRQERRKRFDDWSNA